MTSELNESGGLDQKAQFYDYFQKECSALSEMMDKVSEIIHASERNDALQNCQTGISHLAEDVKHASHHIPAYDQKAYAEGIKALSERLQQIKATYAPRPKFSFKSARKIASPAPGKVNTSLNEPSHSVHAGEGPPGSGGNDGSHRFVTQPSASRETGLTISSRSMMHVTPPSFSSHAASSGMLSDLSHCVVDISPATGTEKLLATLTIKNTKNSLLVCGNVSGPTHITGVQHSVILLACRQFRMHECKNVDVYLHCTSRPIIEDCNGIRFVPLPQNYVIAEQLRAENQWDKVDDFRWLKAEKSPHWAVLPEADRVTDDFWRTQLSLRLDTDGVETVLSSFPVISSEKQ